MVGDGESLARSVEVALHESGNGRGIDTAGEKHAERDVAHEAHANGLLQALTAFGDPGGIAARLRLGIWNLPVLADLGLRRCSGDVEREGMGRRELAGVAGERAGPERASK